MNEEQPVFIGHQPRECGEHRTVGSHRAWCFDCREWCYPSSDGGCKGCRLPILEAKAELADYIATQIRGDSDGWIPAEWLGRYDKAAQGRTGKETE